MRHKLGRVFIVLGALLILVAAFIVGRYWIEGEQAGDASDSALAKVKESIDDRNLGELNPSRDMSELLVDGYSYIGYLSIPSVDLELPVQSTWSYEGLRVSPACYSGSVFANNMVICGHSYRRHFAKLYNIEIGAKVTFTTMDGDVFNYTVSSLDTLDPTSVYAMTETTTDWDLTLFTCTDGGSFRWTVRCTRDTVAWAG